MWKRSQQSLWIILSNWVMISCKLTLMLSFSNVPYFFLALRAPQTKRHLLTSLHHCTSHANTIQMDKLLYGWEKNIQNIFVFRMNWPFQNPIRQTAFRKQSGHSVRWIQYSCFLLTNLPLCEEKLVSVSLCCGNFKVTEWWDFCFHWNPSDPLAVRLFNDGRWGTAQLPRDDS